jgi:hypothetical protein
MFIYSSIIKSVVLIMWSPRLAPANHAHAGRGFPTGISRAPVPCGMSHPRTGSSVSYLPHCALASCGLEVTFRRARRPLIVASLLRRRSVVATH